MIKKFEAYNPKKLDIQFIIDAFADLIDDGLAEYSNDPDGEFIEIYVELGENLYQEGIVANFQGIIRNGEKQLEIMKDINTAILRTKDELNIEPFIEFMTYESVNANFKFYIRIEYNNA